jgi:hypothetical protein
MIKKARWGVDYYSTLGLTSNPFAVQALKADELGKRLMIGRDDEIDQVAQRLHKHGKITCLDGRVGVGKTSLVNVATYECFQAFLAGETPQLLIPLSESFQLSRDENLDAFCATVFRKVANGLMSQIGYLGNYQLSGPPLLQVSAWLNSPIIHQLRASGPAAASASGGTANAHNDFPGHLNTSTGFAYEGFENLVRTWLNEIFAVQGNGGVVCVIDNLELLESGPIARRTLEALRDRLFNVNGLRWVFCGANGVIHSLAASPRLGAFLNAPIMDVGEVAPRAIRPLVQARLEEYLMNADQAESCLPIRMEDIEYLYKILNFNLRELLAHLDQYCEHQVAIGKGELTAKQKEQRFSKWLESITVKSYSELSSRIQKNAWAVLDVAMSDAFKGTFGVGDYVQFNSNSKVGVSQSSFAKWLRDLEKLGLLSKSIDDAEDDGFKRDVFTVTAKGSLVHYARLVRNETESLFQVDWLRRVHSE